MRSRPRADRWLKGIGDQILDSGGSVARGSPRKHEDTKKTKGLRDFVFSWQATTGPDLAWTLLGSRGIGEVAFELRRPAIAAIERDVFDVAGPLTAGHAGGQIRRLGIAGGEYAEWAQLTQAARIAVMEVLVERARR